MIMDIWHYIEKGGWAMFPIILTMLGGFFLFFLRLTQLRDETKQVKKINRCLVLIAQGKSDEFASDIKDATGSIGRLLQCGFENRHLPKSKLEDVLKQVFYDEHEGIHRHLGTLQMIANILPMLGLVGTVTGIITVFKVIGASGGGDPQAMGQGISEALVATQSGLVGAIPILFGHHLLADKADRVVIEMKRIATAFINAAEA